jgi:hypothetical protein
MSFSSEAIATVRRMASQGAGEEAIALETRLSRASVREIAELLGVSLDKLERGEWCIRCGNPRSHLNPKTGWCDICTARVRLEEQRQRDFEEEERLREEAERENAVVRKRRQRMREEFDANPRK